jgi:hypothetical protein
LLSFRSPLPHQYSDTAPFHEAGIVRQVWSWFTNSQIIKAQVKSPCPPPLEVIIITNSQVNVMILTTNVKVTVCPDRLCRTRLWYDIRVLNSPMSGDPQGIAVGLPPRGLLVHRAIPAG